MAFPASASFTRVGVCLIPDQRRNSQPWDLLKNFLQQARGLQRKRREVESEASRHCVVSKSLSEKGFYFIVRKEALLTNHKVRNGVDKMNQP